LLQEPRLDLPSDCHPKVRALLSYWQSKLRGRAMPARRDITPFEIPELLPHLFMVDVPLAGPMVYRLCGTAVVALLGHDVTGRPIGEGMVPAHRAEAVTRYAGIAAGARPFFHRARLRENTNDFAKVDRLVLPLSDDGMRVNILLGMTIRRLEPEDVSAPGQ
jgi:hypothetical protein